MHCLEQFIFKTVHDDQGSMKQLLQFHLALTQPGHGFMTQL